MMWRYLVTLLCAVQMVQAIDPWITPPQTISTPGAVVDSPCISLDAAGNAIAVWIEDGQLVSAECAYGGIWSSLSTVASGVTSVSHLKIDSVGEATVIWLTGGVIYTASKPLGGTWSAPLALSGSGASEDVLAMDLTGNLVVVWKESDYIQSVTRPFGGAWQGVPDVISSLGASMPDVAVGGEGLVVAVWQTATNEIQSASKVLGGGWGAEETLSIMNIKACCPKVTIDDEGNATAAWFRFNESAGLFSNVIVQVIRRPFGENWELSRDISPESIASSVNPSQLRLIIDSYESSSVIVLWTSCYNGALYNLEWEIFQWGKWQVPSPFIGMNQTMITFSADVNYRDNAYVVSSFLDPGSGENSIIAGLLNLDSLLPGMGVIWRLSVGGNNAYPCTSVNHTGISTYAGTIWIHNDGTNNCIQVLVAQIPIVLPPSNLSVNYEEQDYGVFVQYNNNLSWTASPSLGVIGYVIYRNGVYVKTVGKNTLSYLDFNRVNESGTYSIYAYNRYYLSSDTVSINYSNVIP